MMCGYLFCACLFMIAVQLVGTERSSGEVLNQRAPPLRNPSVTKIGVSGSKKSRALFSRRGQHQRLLGSQKAVKLQKPKPAQGSCSKEDCTVNKPCCDPCAICRCRLFLRNCYCWRPQRHCHRMS